MDFENEPYVRYYRRKTTTWLLLSWQAQAILSEILVLVDRAGVLELGGLAPAEAIGLHLPKWPAEVVGTGIGNILDRGILEHRGDCLVWPKYLSGQEAPQSDRARKAESRAKRRDNARNGNVTNRDQEVTKRDPTVTNCDEKSRLVTACHTRSHAVTPILSDPIPAEPAVSPNRPPKRRASGQGEYSQEFERVWAEYPKRGGANPKYPAFESWRARRASGVSAEELESAVKRYARFCEATGKIGTETVQQTASFFGPKKAGWKETWDVPEQPASKPANGVRKLQLVTGKVIEIKPGVRVEFTDQPDAIDGFVMVNGKLSVRSGAKWL